MIYFYDCAAGTDLENRACTSYQFYSGYQVPAAFPLATLNKWNTDKRYAKAYFFVQSDKTTSARIEIDVLVSGTGADPSRTYLKKRRTVRMRSAKPSVSNRKGFK